MKFTGVALNTPTSWKLWIAIFRFDPDSGTLMKSAGASGQPDGVHSST
jgi:hypothetical protein